MKKNIWIITLVVLMAGSSLVSAEEMKDGMKGNMMADSKGSMMNEGMMGKGMMKDGMMDCKKMGMCPMMKSMMDRNVTATSDGGIVVVSCNKLTKYDKDLNLVKEIELKMDMEGMHKMMENMKGMCPMMEKMKSSDKSGTKESVEEEKAEHKSHH